MAVTDWNVETINGRRYLTVSVAQFRIDLDDPDGGLFIAVAMPLGGIGNLGAFLKGDSGPSSTILPAIDFTALENGDPTADFAFLTKVAPATEIAGEVYQLSLGLHKGPAGDDGTAVLDLSSYGTPLPGKILIVNDTSDDLEYATQKVGDRFIPASLASASAQTAFTICQIPVDAQEFDWRPEVSGQTIVSPNGSDCRVDVIARLNAETTGHDVGRGFGIAGATERINFTDGPPAGSADTYDKVAAGDDATIFIRVERQSGSNTFDTSSTTSRFSVKVCPVP